MIYLMRIRGGDPFNDYPILHTVWKGASGLSAADISRRESRSGELYYIVKDREVVGITGYWTEKGSIYLRWTGIAPEHRRKGYMREAMTKFMRHLADKFSSYTKVVELVPDTEHGRENVKPFFEALGFIEDNEVWIPPGEAEEHPMLPFVFSLECLR